MDLSNLQDLRPPQPDPLFRYFGSVSPYLHFGLSPNMVIDPLPQGNGTLN